MSCWLAVLSPCLTDFVPWYIYNPARPLSHISSQARNRVVLLSSLPGGLPNPELNPGASTVQAWFFISEHQGTIILEVLIPSEVFQAQGTEVGSSALKANSLSAELSGKALEI